MKYDNWFEEQYKKLENDPLYIAAGLMIEINEKFCERMKELGMSQRDLAKAIGKSQPYISRILNHGTNMTLETLALLAVALKMEIKAPELVPIKQEVEPKTVNKKHLKVISSPDGSDKRVAACKKLKPTQKTPASGSRKKRAV
jgi:transcriptional regulator with XRE-family HTH domain